MSACYSSIMKFLGFPLYVVPHALFCLLLTVPSVMEARIGESRTALERRLLSSGAILYRDEEIKKNRSQGMLYLKYMDLMPESAQLFIYYKTHDGRKPKSSQMEEKRIEPGWDIHVLFVQGISVMEVYRRSQPMSEPEMNLLLTTLAEGSYWKKVKPDPNNKEAPPTVFGYGMERADLKVRGKMLGRDTLVVFDVGLDAGLAEMQMEDEIECAPESIKGF